MKAVLERGGGFSGINRKVQLKPLKWDVPSINTDELHSRLVSPHLRAMTSPPPAALAALASNSNVLPSPSGMPPSAPFERGLNISGREKEGKKAEGEFGKWDNATPIPSEPSSPTRDNEKVTQALLILKVRVSLLRFVTLLTSRLVGRRVNSYWASASNGNRKQAFSRYVPNGGWIFATPFHLQTRSQDIMT